MVIPFLPWTFSLCQDNILIRVLKISERTMCYIQRFIDNFISWVANDSVGLCQNPLKLSYAIWWRKNRWSLRGASTSEFSATHTKKNDGLSPLSSPVSSFMTNFANTKIYSFHKGCCKYRLWFDAIVVQWQWACVNPALISLLRAMMVIYRPLGVLLAPPKRGRQCHVVRHREISCHHIPVCS